MCSGPNNNPEQKKTTSDLLLSRALHIITLQLHGLDSDIADTSGAACGATAAAHQIGEGAEELGDPEAFFAAVTEGNGKAISAAAASDGSGGGPRGSQGQLKTGKGGGSGAGGVAEETSICELLGRVAGDHGGLGLLFEDGLWVCKCVMMLV